MKIYVVLNKRDDEIVGIFKTYQEARERIPIFTPSAIIEYELESILLTKEQHEYLCERDEKLSALEMGGVDNWEWYEESLKDYYGEKK